MDVGVQDTILAVREMQRSGILVVGIYFGSGQESFCQRIYPNLVICEPTNLPNALGSVLKRVLRS
jgi:nitric oxide reductase activation protein